MAMLSARIPDPLAARFAAFAAVRGGKSRVLRQLMEAAITGEPVVAAPASSSGGRSAKVTLRLKPEDLVALDAACADTGLRRTEWVVALVRRRLAGAPQFDRSASTALLDARRQLRRMSVHLREMAGASTLGRGEHVADHIEALRTEIRVQLERLREAIVGNLAYWSGDAP